MDRGDIFEFKGDRFVARDVSGTTVLASRLGVDKNGVEAPRVGKPRTFKDLTANVVGFIKLKDKRQAGSGHTSHVDADDDASEPEQLQEESREESPEEIERRKQSVERLTKLTAGPGSDEW